MSSGIFRQQLVEIEHRRHFASEGEERAVNASMAVTRTSGGGCWLGILTAEMSESVVESPGRKAHGQSNDQATERRECQDRSII